VTNASSPILKFHAVGDWPPGRVSVARGPSSRPVLSQVEVAIDAAWRDAVAQPGVKLFDGKMCRLESWNATADQLGLLLSETTYKTFLGTNLTHPEFADQYGQQILANPVGVSPALLTADGFLMMGRRNASVAYYPNRVHPFAGALDPPDADPFAAVRRELREELSFADEDVADLRCTGIAEDLSIRQPELMFLARSARTRAEIESRLDATEHEGTWAVEADEYGVRRTLESDEVRLGETFTPVAVASLLLYGFVTFGGDFFRRFSAEFMAD
jgi:8-oxo-dGTP pyrophosphatase MutT (NUDIX family)